MLIIIYNDGIPRNGIWNDIYFCKSHFTTQTSPNPIPTFPNFSIIFQCLKLTWSSTMVPYPWRGTGLCRVWGMMAPPPGVGCPLRTAMLSKKFMWVGVAPAAPAHTILCTCPLGGKCMLSSALRLGGTVCLTMAGCWLSRPGMPWKGVYLLLVPFLLALVQSLLLKIEICLT